ncbi:serine protease [Orbilia oligospora]|uniref:Serine protease n=1 Tax=Orbilia oligospora TaxID=2813651 RepID=A0A7C8NLC8_ORBOL|nr:serine protease [Orbilia oligospora]
MKVSLALFVVAIFAVIPSGCCAPLERGNKSETSPKGRTTKPATAQKDDPEPEPSDTYLSYLVLFKDSENRPWETIIANMGFGAAVKENKHPKRGSLASRALDQGDSRYFTTLNGRQLHAFGGGEGTMRVLKMNMTLPEVERVTLLEYVEFVEENKRIPVFEPLPEDNPGVKPSPGLIRPATVPYINAPGFECRRRGFDGRDLPIIEQCGAPWGLYRISSYEPPVFTSSASEQASLSYTYRFREGAGIGVDIYILDTSLNENHPDFEGRAKLLWIPTDVDDNPDMALHGFVLSASQLRIPPKHSFENPNFCLKIARIILANIITWMLYRTHVAGIAASRTFGVAKGAMVYGVAVIVGDDILDEDIYGGGNAILRHHRGRRDRPSFAGSIVNISAGVDEGWPAIEIMVGRFLREGIHVTVSAGNRNKDACGASPAGMSRIFPVITTGAIAFDDQRHPRTSWGRCVDVYAPGINIASLSSTSNTVPAVLSGTSMAVPHVAGVMAAELTFRPEFKFDPSGLKRFILDRAIKGGVKLKRSKEDEKVVGGRLLLNNASPGPPVQISPAKSFLPDGGF